MKKQDFVEYIVHDLMGRIEGITYRAMFGGYGIYKEGIIFALIAYDKLYFKVGETNIKDFKKFKSKPFTYQRKNHPATVMSYYELPTEIMEDQQKLKKWVERAYLVSKNRKK